MFESFAEIVRATKRPVRLRFVVLAGLLALALALFFFLDLDPDPNPREPATKDGNPLALRVRAQGHPQKIGLEPNALVDFDGLSQAEVLAIRQSYLDAQPLLFDAQEYSPSGAVFGRVEDGAAWWGIDGIYLHGPGELAVTGPAEESRWIVNPFALVGINETKAFVWKRAQTGRWEPSMLGLEWQPGQGHFVVRYDLSNYFALKSMRRDESHDLSLTTMNAQDFGMRHIYLDAEASEGVRLSESAAGVGELRQYLHRGGSCGYSGGCNNGSPGTPELDFEVTDLPASIVGKLWAQSPASPTEPADLSFEIHLEAGMSQQLPVLYVPLLCDPSALLRTCFDSTLSQCEESGRAAVQACMGEYEGGFIPNVDDDWYAALGPCISTRLRAAPPGPFMPEGSECRGMKP